MSKLLSTKNAVLWLDIHELEFQKLKQILTSDLLVKTFDPNFNRWQDRQNGTLNAINC